MKQSPRPTQISSILETICSSSDTEICTELEAYIADLEAKQPDRPAHIVAILNTIRSQYPGDTGDSLETYISDLEAKQQATQAVPSSFPSSPAIWSHQHQSEREQDRLDRASRKRNNYQ